VRDFASADASGREQSSVRCLNEWAWQIRARRFPPDGEADTALADAALRAELMSTDHGPKVLTSSHRAGYNRHSRILADSRVPGLNKKIRVVAARTAVSVEAQKKKKGSEKGQLATNLVLFRAELKWGYIPFRNFPRGITRHASSYNATCAVVSHAEYEWSEESVLVNVAVHV